MSISPTTPYTADAIIDNVVGSVAVAGSITVAPLETTTYTITADGVLGPITANFTVYVDEAPDLPIANLA